MLDVSLLDLSSLSRALRMRACNRVCHRLACRFENFHIFSFKCLLASISSNLQIFLAPSGKFFLNLNFRINLLKSDLNQGGKENL